MRMSTVFSEKSNRGNVDGGAMEMDGIGEKPFRLQVSDNSIVEVIKNVDGNFILTYECLDSILNAMKELDATLSPLFCQSVVINTWNTLTGEGQWDYVTTVKNVDGRVSVQSSSEYIRNCVQIDSSTAMPTLFLTTYEDSNSAATYDPTGKFKIPKVPTKYSVPRMKKPTTRNIKFSSKSATEVKISVGNNKHDQFEKLSARRNDEQPSVHRLSKGHTKKNLGRSGRKLFARYPKRDYNTSGKEVSRRYRRKRNTPRRANANLDKIVLYVSLTRKQNKNQGCNAPGIIGTCQKLLPTENGNEKYEDTHERKNEGKAAMPLNLIEDLDPGVNTIMHHTSMQEAQQINDEICDNGIQLEPNKKKKSTENYQGNTPASLTEEHTGQLNVRVSHASDKTYPFMPNNQKGRTALSEIPINVIYEDTVLLAASDRQPSTRRRKNSYPTRILTYNPSENNTSEEHHNLQRGGRRRRAMFPRKFSFYSRKNASRRKHVPPLKMSSFKTSDKTAPRRSRKIQLPRKIVRGEGTQQYTEDGGTFSTQEIREQHTNDGHELVFEMIGPAKPIIPYSSGLEIYTDSPSYSDVSLDTVDTNYTKPVKGN